MARGYREDRKRKIRIMPLRGIPEVTTRPGNTIWLLPGTGCSMANLALPSSDNGAARPLPVWHGLQQPAVLYGLAISLVAFAFVLRSLLAPTQGDQALYLFLVPPVLIA